MPEIIKGVIMEPQKKFIDLKKIFAEKNPRLSGLIPSFVMNYIRKIIHEEEINEFISIHGDKMDFEFIHAIISWFNIKIIVVGEENIPLQGGFVLAANHPLGGLDGIALMMMAGRKRKDLKFIVNDILLQLKNLSGVFIGINKHGKNLHENLHAIDALYASENGVVIFPAGLVSRNQDGTIKDLEWKKSFITKAKKYKRNIIPVHIGGTNTKRFYAVASWRKRLGIKANIEMFFLPDEMYKQHNKTITFTIGEAIPYQNLDKSRTDLEWAQWIKEKVYALKPPKENL
ncbi:MAG: 1-acyl-sn-glycerol-3-phosphate acyltransferase [Bacteroidia bacterium]